MKKFFRKIFRCTTDVPLSMNVSELTIEQVAWEIRFGSGSNRPIDALYLIQKYRDQEIRKAVEESIRGYTKWLETNCDIVDKTTHEIIPNSMVDINSSAVSLMDEIYKKIKIKK